MAKRLNKYPLQDVPSLLIIRNLIGVVLVLMFCNAHAGMQTGDLSRAKNDAENNADAMERIRELMYREIDNPTERRPGGGVGHIYHDYLMMQIITAYRNLLTPPKGGRRAAAKEEDIHHLTRMLEEEDNLKAKEVFMIVLTYVGVQDYADSLVEMIVLGRQGQQVRRSAINALASIDYAVAIPEIIEMLSDTSGEPAPYINRAEGITKYIYPAQRAAAFALRDFGVPVKEVINGVHVRRYEANRDVAVSVLTSRLAESSCEKQAFQLLDSIVRVDGEKAIKALQDYVRDNENRPDKQKIVAEAKRLLRAEDVTH